MSANIRHHTLEETNNGLPSSKRMRRSSDMMMNNNQFNSNNMNENGISNYMYENNSQQPPLPIEYSTSDPMDNSILPPPPSLDINDNNHNHNDGVHMHNVNMMQSHSSSNELLQGEQSLSHNHYNQQSMPLLQSQYTNSLQTSSIISSQHQLQTSTQSISQMSSMMSPYQNNLNNMQNLMPPPPPLVSPYPGIIDAAHVMHPPYETQPIPKKQHGRTKDKEEQDRLRVDWIKYQQMFEKWIFDLKQDGVNVDCFLFKQGEGVFCKICMQANKKGVFVEKGAYELARRCLTKHLSRDKHLNALRKLYNLPEDAIPPGIGNIKIEKLRPKNRSLRKRKRTDDDDDDDDDDDYYDDEDTYYNNNNPIKTEFDDPNIIQQHAGHFIQAPTGLQQMSSNGVPFEIQRNPTMEFEDKFQHHFLAVHWICKQGIPFENYMHLIDLISVSGGKVLENEYRDNKSGYDMLKALYDAFKKVEKQQLLQQSSSQSISIKEEQKPEEDTKGNKDNLNENKEEQYASMILYLKENTRSIYEYAEIHRYAMSLFLDRKRKMNVPQLE